MTKVWLVAHSAGDATASVPVDEAEQVTRAAASSDADDRLVRAGLGGAAIAPHRTPVAQRRRRRFGARWLLLLAVVAGGSVPHRAAAEPERPNIVVFLADDLNERLFDSNLILQAYARQGLRLRATAPSPLCAPSRASILTGLHAHNHGILNNTHANRQTWLERHDGRALPDWLKAVGYRTIFAGKFMNGCSDCPGRSWDVVLRVEKKRSRPRRPYWLDELTRLAVRAIEATPAEQPLFLLFAPSSPHGPFFPSWRHAGKEQRSAAVRKRVLAVPSFGEADVSDKRLPLILTAPLFDAATIEGIVALQRLRGEMLWSIVDALRTLRRALRPERSRDTYVIFLSDNGFFQGEHRRPAGKALPYEEAVTVPMFITGPDVPRDGVSPALVYNLDVTATVADLARAPTPPLDGRSLAALWRGGADAWRKRVLIEHHDGFGAPSFVGVREQAMKAVTFPDGSGETYDLLSDPYELDSIDGTSDFRRASREILQRLLSCSGAACWQAETAGPDATAPGPAGGP